MSSNGTGACGNCGSLSPWRCGCPGNDVRSWREQMEDLAAAVWTGRKASWQEICDEVKKFTGKPVNRVEAEDALKHLDVEDVRKVLVGLKIPAEDLDKHGMLDTELCPECFALPGECEPTCGQYEEPEEDSPKVDLPETEDGMVKLLDEALYAWLDEYCGAHPKWDTKTFEEAQIMTKNKGLVVKVGDREFQLTVVRSR